MNHIFAAAVQGNVAEWLVLFFFMIVSRFGVVTLDCYGPLLRSTVTPRCPHTRDTAVTQRGLDRRLQPTSRALSGLSRRGDGLSRSARHAAC